MTDKTKMLIMGRLERNPEWANTKTKKTICSLAIYKELNANLLGYPIV